jgi:predicted DNA-binding transcriptional regulator AlpA
MADQPRWLSARSLAKRLAVHRTTLWRWVRDGKLPPPTKLSPRCLRWREDVIEDWEAECAGEAA